MVIIYLFILQKFWCDSAVIVNVYNGFPANIIEKLT